VCADKGELVDAMLGLEGGRTRPVMGRHPRRRVKSMAAYGLDLLGHG
jgi:hypothetical protein